MIYNYCEVPRCKITWMLGLDSRSNLFGLGLKTVALALAWEFVALDFWSCSLLWSGAFCHWHHSF